MTWMQTRSGKRVDMVNPTPDSIDIFDIAWAIAHQCRFAGHTRRFYSVAEHLCWCHDEAELVYGQGSMQAKAALIHDAHEAYVVDVPRPLKGVLRSGERFGTYDYDRVEACFEAVVTERLLGGPVSPLIDAQVKKIDMAVLTAEAQELMCGDTGHWVTACTPAAVPQYVRYGELVTPEAACRAWLSRAYRLGMYGV